MYTLLPYLAQKRFRSGCISYGHGNLRDAMTTVESHEFAEAATDPRLNGWTTDQGTGSYEIGDLCAYPGVHVPLGPPEEVQLLWSNQDNGCEPVPTLGVDPGIGPTVDTARAHRRPFRSSRTDRGPVRRSTATRVSANALGSFTARLAVPAGAREGYYVIQATGRLSGRVSTASFDVVTDTWPQLGFDASHSADNPAPTLLDATTASHLEVAWTGGTDGHHSANPLSTGRGYSSSATAWWSKGRPMPPSTTVTSTPTTSVVVMSATVTCSPTWYAELGGNVYGAAAISGNDVYVAASNGILYTFSATCGTNDAECTPLWTARTAGGIDSSPTVQDGVIYVGSSADATDGDQVWLSAFPVDCAKVCRPLWQADIPLHGPEVASSPTVADGMVYEVAGLVWAFPVGCGVGGAMCQPLWAYPWKTETVGINTPVVASGQEIYSLSGFGVLDSPARCPKVTNVATVPGGRVCELNGEPDWWGRTWPSDQWSVALYRGYLFSSSNRLLYGYLTAACASSFVPSAPVLCPPLWTAQPGLPDETTTVFTSGPSIANGVVFAPVDARSGRHLYAYRTVGCTFTCQRPLAAVAWPRFAATFSPAVSSDRSSERARRRLPAASSTPREDGRGSRSSPSPSRPRPPHSPGGTPALRQRRSPSVDRVDEPGPSWTTQRTGICLWLDVIRAAEQGSKSPSESRALYTPPGYSLRPSRDQSPGQHRQRSPPLRAGCWSHDRSFRLGKGGERSWRQH